MGCDRYKHFENCPYDTECPDHKYWEKIEASSVRVERLVINRNLRRNLMDEKRVRILAEVAFEKKQRFEMLGMINQETEPEARKKQFVEYELARAEMTEANAKLCEAQGL